MTATGALCSRRWSGWWGWGLALDHSDTSHSSLRCIYSVLSEQQRCIIDPYNRPHTRIFPHFYVLTDLCRSFRQAAGWILLGSCSAPQWLCLYMSCRSRHCWRRRSLQMAGQNGKREREEEGVNNGPLLLKEHDKSSRDTEGGVGWDKASCSRNTQSDNRIGYNVFFSVFSGSFVNTQMKNLDHNNPVFTFLYRNQYSVRTQKVTLFFYNWQQWIITARQKYMTLYW